MEYVCGIVLVQLLLHLNHVNSREKCITLYIKKNLNNPLVIMTVTLCEIQLSKGEIK